MYKSTQQVKIGQKRTVYAYNAIAKYTIKRIKKK